MDLGNGLQQGKVFLQVSILLTEKDNFWSYFGLFLHFSRAENDTVGGSITESTLFLFRPYTLINTMLDGT